MSDEKPGIVVDADTAYEAIRSINHITINAHPIPAPVIYSVLGNLKTAVGYGAQQALGQLADRLTDSLAVYLVTEDDQARDPAVSVATAAEHMRAAATLAGQIGQHLTAAQNAIAGQGHRGRIDVDEYEDEGE